MRQLHRKLGNAERWFDFKHTNPRMLPREFNPRRLDVAVQHLTPEKVARFGSTRGYQAFIEKPALAVRCGGMMLSCALRAGFGSMLLMLTLCPCG